MRPSGCTSVLTVLPTETRTYYFGVVFEEFQQVQPDAPLDVREEAEIMRSGAAFVRCECDYVANESGRRVESARARSSQDLSAKRNLVLTVIAGWLLITGCARGPQRNQLLSTNADWREFQGTWSAAGSRTTMQLERTHEASISRLTGSLLLSGPSRPAVGFRAEAIVFNDSLSGMVGRAVWTDERGDQAFSDLRGQGTKTANRIFGTFTGGTGRYAGISGGYEFSWRFLLESEDGDVQGQSFGLTGRVRVDATGAAGSEGHGQ